MKKFMLILLLQLVIISCNNDDNGDKNNDCRETPCTLDFRSVGISISNQNGEDVILDSYTVINLGNNEDITVEDDNSQDGNYPIATDSLKSGNKNSEVEVRFTGSLNGDIVVNELYVLGFDCCHISLISGETQISINR